MENEQSYKIEYDEFIASYNNTQLDGMQIGLAVVKMVQHFIRINTEVAAAEIALNKVAAEMAQEIDEKTAKPISMAKSEVLTKNTPEYETYRIAKTDRENVEQSVNALKSLQRGITQEMNYSNV